MESLSGNYRMRVDPDLYHKAFLEYLRKGTPIKTFIKQARPTRRYIWRTRGDGKVRSSHADRDGQVYSWDHPPEGGHPGQDYNCRCVAEPYYEDDPLIAADPSRDSDARLNDASFQN
ncbi:MAG: phage minor head protein, partial [Pseudomonadota bacterium]